MFRRNKSLLPSFEKWNRTPLPQRLQQEKHLGFLRIPKKTLHNPGDESPRFLISSPPRTPSTSDSPCVGNDANESFWCEKMPEGSRALEPLQ